MDLPKPSLKKKNVGEWPHGELEALYKRIPKIVFRYDWAAQAAKEEVFLHLPATNLVFTTTRTEECHDKEECLRAVRKLQKRDMNERGLVDIQYNFYIGGDGGMYEGRGWHVNSTKDPEYAALEGKSIDIAYIGDFNKDKPPGEKAIKGAKTLQEYLWVHCYMAEKYDKYGLGESEPVDGERYYPNSKIYKLVHS